MRPRQTFHLTLLAAGAACAAVWLAWPETAARAHERLAPDSRPPTAKLTDAASAASVQMPAHSVEKASDHPFADSDAPDFLRALPPDLIDTPTAADALTLWAAHDPAAALAWLSTLHPAPPAHLVVTVVRSWLAKDPDALRQHLTALPSNPWAQQLLARAGRLALQQNLPADAVAWLARASPEHRSDAELLCAVGAWGRVDLASALEWAAAEPDPLAQETRLAAALVGRAAIAPTETLDLALGLLDSGPSRDHVLAEFMAEWARLDPRAAAGALARLPEGDTRHGALSALLAVWHDYDPAAAHAWAGLAPQPLRPRADAELARLATGR